MRYDEFKEDKTIVCGIYCIVNLINGKKYIGKSVNIYKRWREHLKADGSCPVFHRAIRKYDVDTFEFLVLDECYEESSLDNMEISAIKEYDSLVPQGCNLALGGQGGAGTLASAEAKEKHAKNLVERWTDEYRAKMSIALRKGYDDMSEDAKLATANKISLAASTPEMQLMRSEWSKKLWLDVEHRKNISEKSAAYHNRPDVKEIKSEQSKERWRSMSVDETDKALAVLKAVTSTPEAKEKQSISSKMYWGTEEYREKQAKGAKEAFSRRTDEDRTKTRDALYKTLATPESTVKRAFMRRNNGSIPTFDVGWALAITKGVSLEYYAFALDYYCKKYNTTQEEII